MARVIRYTPPEEVIKPWRRGRPNIVGVIRVVVPLP
jgi:hypothetical protein